MQFPEHYVAIVTGASSGIGEAIARRLHGAGARLVVVARREDRLQALARELDPSGGRVLAIVADVTREEDRERLVEDCLAKYGRIDALVNNAGYGHRGPLECVSVEALRQNFETNVFSLIALTQRVIPVMRKQGSGRIVNIGSVAGRFARPLSSIYDSTKHALEALTDGLRGELAPFGIEVVLVRPGFILSEFGDTARRVSAEVLEHPGPYAPYLSGFQDSSARLRKLAGHPDEIAWVVQRALTARRPCTHYAAPGHAKAILFLKWLLPTRALDWFVRLKK